MPSSRARIQLINSFFVKPMLLNLSTLGIENSNLLATATFFATPSHTGITKILHYCEARPDHQLALLLALHDKVH